MVAKVVAVLCLAGVVLGAPQKRQTYPQLIQRNGYLQPQLIRDAYHHQQIVSPYQYDQGYIHGLGSPLLYNQFPGLKTYSAPAPQYYKQPIVPIAPKAYAAGVAPRTAAILRQAQDSSLDGAYSYGFESEDGIALQTSAGPLTPVGPEDSIQTVSGSYSYTAPDGTPITTNWIADENGFRAEGAHLPKAPEPTYRTA